jgi:protein-L-isoaspartate(D-aspartate) O-methyltransferase
VYLLEPSAINRYVRQLIRAAVLLLATMGPTRTSDLFTAERDRMVRAQIESRGIQNREVIRAIRATPRHLFVPKAVQAEAYDDHALPIGYGATISQPYIVAFMTELLGPAKQQRVLEIGTGSGYQAAVLAQLVSQVYSVEIVPELAESARKTLNALGYSNVLVRQGETGTKAGPRRRVQELIVVDKKPEGTVQRPLGPSVMFIPMRSSHN